MSRFSEPSVLLHCTLGMEEKLRLRKVICYGMKFYLFFFFFFFFLFKTSIMGKGKNKNKQDIIIIYRLQSLPNETHNTQISSHVDFVSIWIRHQKMKVFSNHNIAYEVYIYRWVLLPYKMEIAFYYKKQKYIWFRTENLKGFQDIKPYMN